MLKNFVRFGVSTKASKLKFKGFGGALSATQMKQITGGTDETIGSIGDDSGCVACGVTCYYDGKKCCPGGSCKEVGPEQGRICN